MRRFPAQLVVGIGGVGVYFFYIARATVNALMIYRYTGQAENHDEVRGKEIGYDLISIYDTFWRQAQKGENETYGESLDYETRSFFRVLAGKSPGEMEETLPEETL